MIENYKKGDILFIEYKKKNHKDIFQSVGIVFEISKSRFTLTHNFSGTLTIDSTKISISDIIKIQKITPKEINSTNDMMKN